MKPRTILLPIDVAECPREAFKVVNGFAERPGVTVILLAVVNLNMLAPENRVYAGLACEAHAHLERLAREYLPRTTATLMRVRLGKPAEEIIAAAKEDDADLIILPMRRAPVWKRCFAPFFPKNVVKLIRDAPCGVFVTEVRTCVNCERHWGRPVKEISLARDDLAESVRANDASLSSAQSSWATACQPNLARANR